MLANQKPGKKVNTGSSSDVTSQNLQFHHLHDNNPTRVSENLHPGRSFQKSLVSVARKLRLRVDEWPNRIEKAVVLKIPVFMWTGPIRKQ